MPSLMNIFGVAGSAMSAQSQRLNVTASNLANADSTTGPDGQPYKAKQVVFAVSPLGGARTASGQQVGGVQVTGGLHMFCDQRCVFVRRSRIGGLDCGGHPLVQI